jgi:probable DNA metabolism protein
MRVLGSDQLAEWRLSAGKLLREGIAPDQVTWIDPHDPQSGLEFTDAPAPPASLASGFSTPRELLDLAETALAHRGPEKWPLLYRILWRLTRGGEKHLLKDSGDEDIHALERLVKAVRRDIHKMHAFVRFRRVEDASGAERYIAWHRPDHRIIRLASPFFARRFAAMKWSILTPVGSAHWDTSELTYGPPATRRDAPSDDALEEMWRTYYASTFNPARANERLMRREMPGRYWSALPEADLIDDLLRTAGTRMGQMVGRSAGAAGAAAYIPERVMSLDQLREASRSCRGCDLCDVGTQTVFGEGPSAARLMLIGEQPGDEEDRRGRAFVGPAGKVLDRALADAGLERKELYITNAVKHFKWTPRGKRRMHARPSAREVIACKPWLESEVALVRPDILVLLGSTAAHSVLGAGFRVMQSRGRVIRDTPWARIIVPTIHPSAVLRAGEAADEMYSLLVTDLRTAREALTEARPLRDAG